MFLTLILQITSNLFFTKKLLFQFFHDEFNSTFKVLGAGIEALQSNRDLGIPCFHGGVFKTGLQLVTTNAKQQ